MATEKRLPFYFPDGQKKFALITREPFSFLRRNCCGKAHEKSTSAVRERGALFEKIFEAVTSERLEPPRLSRQPVQKISREKRVGENLQRRLRRFVEQTKSCDFPLDSRVCVERKDEGRG